MKKGFTYLCFVLFTLIIIGVIVGFVQGPAWQRRNNVFGLYIAEENQLLRLNFSVSSRSFWVIYTDINTGEGYPEVLYYGHYTLCDSSQFMFEGDNIGGFESFSIINNNLDIEVIKDGERYIFEHRVDVPFTFGDFDPTFLDSN